MSCCICGTEHAPVKLMGYDGGVFCITCADLINSSSRKSGLSIHVLADAEIQKRKKEKQSVESSDITQMISEIHKNEQQQKQEDLDTFSDDFPEDDEVEMEEFFANEDDEDDTIDAEEARQWLETSLDMVLDEADSMRFSDADEIPHLLEIITSELQVVIRQNQIILDHLNKLNRDKNIS